MPVLLGLQDQLSLLEENLDALEKGAREKNARDVHNGSYRQDTKENRQVLINQAQHLLRDYSQSWPFLGSFVNIARYKTEITEIDKYRDPHWRYCYIFSCFEYPRPGIDDV